MASELLFSRARTVLFKLRPLAALYVAAVSLAGALVIARAIPGANNGHPVALAVLMGLSLAASVAKITIPVTGNDSSLTVCHVVDFTTLIVCGPHAAVVVSAFGGWAQCTLRSANRNPLHRVVFSVAALGLTMGERSGAKWPLAVVGAVLLGATSWPAMKYAVALMGGVFGALVGTTM